MLKVAFYFRRQLILAVVLLLITLVVSCTQHEVWKAYAKPSTPFVVIPIETTSNSKEILKPTPSESIRTLSNSPRPSVSSPTPVPTPSILGANYDFGLDLHSSPVTIPLRLQIPILDVDAPMLAVGLTEGNNMDAPKGPYGDPNWSSTFWYRGSAIPGEPGTATVAGHVNGMLGEPETFARIRRLKPGDLIIIKVTDSDDAIYFVVDEVKKYSLTELSEPELSQRIFGGGMGSDGKRITDGVAHLTLITCTGNYKDGEFDNRIIVFATLRN